MPTGTLSLSPRVHSPADSAPSSSSCISTDCSTHIPFSTSVHQVRSNQDTQQTKINSQSFLDQASTFIAKNFQLHSVQLQETRLEKQTAILNPQFSRLYPLLKTSSNLNTFLENITQSKMMFFSGVYPVAIPNSSHYQFLLYDYRIKCYSVVEGDWFHRAGIDIDQFKPDFFDVHLKHPNWIMEHCIKSAELVHPDFFLTWKTQHKDYRDITSVLEPEYIKYTRNIDLMRKYSIRFQEDQEKQQVQKRKKSKGVLIAIATTFFALAYIHYNYTQIILLIPALSTLTSKAANLLGKHLSSPIVPTVSEMFVLRIHPKTTP